MTADELFLVIVAAGVGLIFGSFATAAAYRIPRRESFVTGRSKCPNCGATITAAQNIPVISYLIQRGRCRSCKTRISPRYPLIELGTAVLFAGAAARFGYSVETVVFAAFFWGLVVLTIIDLEHQTLPNRVVFPMFVVGWLGLTAAALVDGDPDRLIRAGIGAAIFGGFFFAVAFAVPKGMGGGDVKLAFVLGTFLGYVGGAGVTAVGMFLSFLLGGIIGLVLTVVGGAGRKTKVPFGPFLALGTVLAVFWGRGLLDAYLDRLT